MVRNGKGLWFPELESPNDRNSSTVPDVTAAAVQHFANFTPEFTLTTARRPIHHRFDGVSAGGRGRRLLPFRAEGKFGIPSSYLTRRRRPSARCARPPRPSVS